MGLNILPRFFPTQGQVRLMTIFFGANDSCLPGNPQHVPLQTYVESLEQLITHQCVRAQGTKVVLVVPAPVDEWGQSPSAPNRPLARTAATTMRYAEACRDVGAKMGVPVVDLWTLFIEAAGWDRVSELPGSKGCAQNEILQRLLPDGKQ
jgi:isoamyl acetate esterase